MIELEQSGSFKNIETFLAKMKKGDLYSSLDSLARKGQMALAAATPVESGATAAQWSYKIKISISAVEIEWYNSSQNQGVPIAILLQYGHGTGTGGYVQGRDYINPALKPIFKEIADSVWKKVKSA